VRAAGTTVAMSGATSPIGDNSTRPGGARSRHESDQERLDRELDELMQELRAVIPGAQVLFGLLLTVAFTERFRELDDTQRYVYFGTFVSALVGLVLLLGPASFHRLRFRRNDKERLLRVANVEMIIALAFVAASIGGVAYLVTSIVLTTTAAAVTSALLVTAAAVVWWVVPLAHGERHRRSTSSGAGRADSRAGGSSPVTP
jgi:hypothetical protein